MKLYPFIPLCFAMTDTTGWTAVKVDPQRIIPLGNDMFLYYYLNELTNPADLSQKIYELHGNCVFNKVDYSTWSQGDLLTCELAFYSSSSDFKDWLILNMSYQGPEEVNSWTCKDGFSTSSSIESE